jgi:PilZ domain-containing protein
MPIGALATREGDSVQTSPQPPEPKLPERRQSRRHRLTVPIKIWLGDGSVPAMTIEISEGGLSAFTNTRLTVDSILVLDPVGGGKASAIVRREMGNIYGFSFQNLTSDQLNQIRSMCASLPVFRSRLDI